MLFTADTTLNKAMPGAFNQLLQRLIFLLHTFIVLLHFVKSYTYTYIT